MASGKSMARCQWNKHPQGHCIYSSFASTHSNVERRVRVVIAFVSGKKPTIMNFSLSKPQVKSGDVMGGTRLCEYLAITLSNSATYLHHASYKSCCLSLANNSKYELTDGQCYMRSGWSYDLPQIIAPISTGFFASAGSRLGSGSAGVMTFQIQNGTNNRLQIMWSVPTLHNIYDLWMNINVGHEDAGLELFNKLYNGNDRAPVKAMDTPSFINMDSFDAIVVMSNHLHSILTVYFEDAPTPGGSHEHMKTFMDLHYKNIPDVRIV